MLKLEINHILVPVDFSETSLNALNHAAEFAKIFNAKLTLLHVYESMGNEILLPEVLAGKKMLDNPYQELVIKKLDEARTSIAAIYSKDVNIAVSEGTIASAVESFVNEEKVDIIVMGTHGTKGVIQNYIIGSNSYKVVGASKVPVLTVRKKVTNLELNNIVVPVDFTKFSRQKLPFAADLAKKYGATLKLFFTEQKEYNELKNNALIDQVENFLRNEGVAFTTQISEEAYSAKEVINYSEFTNSDLIIIMSERETTISNMLLGSTSREVVNHSNIPVLTLHPFEDNAYMDIWK